MYGLVKLAHSYENDPFWNILHEDKKKKEQELSEAKAKRNPELVAKEQAALNKGLGYGGVIGAGVGGLAGISAAIAEKKPLATIPMGLAGALGGGVVGLGVGGLAALPVVLYHQTHEDPEVMSEVYKKRSDNLESGNRLRHYEKNDPIFGEKDKNSY